MGAADGRKPLLNGRGLLSVDGFSHSSGLDPATVERLVTNGVVEGVVDLNGRAVGLFDDALPTAEELQTIGIRVKGDYDPEALRSHEVDIDDPDTGDATPSWSMSWGGDD